MLKSTVVKLAGSVLAPLVLITTRMRSGNAGTSTVRVWNVIVLPLLSVNTGLIMNVFICAVPAPLLKFIARCWAPLGAGLSSVDVNTPVVPRGTLALNACHVPEGSTIAVPGGP